jgi:hypothetical protein
MPIIASCHCGATRIALPAQPTYGGSCNCTYCARAGAVWGYYKTGELEFLSRDGEATYAPSELNQHHFCSKCGMQTWGESPDWGSLYNADGTPKNGESDQMPTDRIFVVNLNLIDDLDWSLIKVEKMDGRNGW